MVRRSLLGALGAAGAVAVLVLGSTAAHATPVPDNGPVAGGTTVSVPEPAGVTFTELAAGYAHSVALGPDGNAYAWGRNWSGQLGDGTTVDRSSPVQVQAPEAGVTFTKIAAGYEHSVALGSDGNVYAWGGNWTGQLGDGTTADRSSPVQVQAPEAGVTFTKIAAGDTHTVALGSDGNAYAWGSNGFGQLGNGTTVHSSSPVQVQAPEAGVTFTEIAAGYAHTVALGSDGNAYAWGHNGWGQLGNGTLASSSSPVQVPAGVTFTELTAGGAHTVALRSDGNAYAWGRNTWGQLGDGTTADRIIPVQVPAGVTFTKIAAGDAHSVALGSDGNAYAWGHNGSGQLGDGTTVNSSSPVQVAGVVEVTNVSFDGIAGTNLVDNGDGTWSVNAPAHPEGPVNVEVTYTWNGIAQTPVTYPEGYTYTPDPVAPTITNPLDQSVANGSTAVFSVTTTGTPTPTVSWEVSRDGGTTWEEITADTAATPAADGLSLAVVGTDANNGYQYRATATNSVGDAVSQAATLTVTPGEGTDTPGEGTEGNVTTELASTGSTATPAVLIAAMTAALTALLLGAGLVTAKRRRRAE